MAPAEKSKNLCILGSHLFDFWVKTCYIYYVWCMVVIPHFYKCSWGEKTPCAHVVVCKNLAPSLVFRHRCRSSWPYPWRPLMREKVRSRKQGQTETPVERVEMNIGRESHNEDKANLGKNNSLSLFGWTSRTTGFFGFHRRGFRGFWFSQILEAVNHGLL